MDFEEPRRQLISKLSDSSTIESAVKIWLPEIRKRLAYTPGASLKAEALYQLGGQLREIFTLTRPKASGSSSPSEGSRSQGNLQKAGELWEFLVVWYLNLLSIGSNIWLTKKKNGLYPSVLDEAFTTDIGNYKSNSEPDLIAFAIPASHTDPFKPSKTKNYRTNRELKIFIDSCDSLIRDHTSHVTTSIIQCKSNWNDSVQTVQLWGILYDESRKEDPKIPEGITVGGSYHPGSFKSFSFAFVTAPSQKDLATYKASRAEVVRVRGLSGGNYWGAESKPNIADSIDNFLNKNFRQYLASSPSEHTKLLDKHLTSVEHFLSLDL